MFELRWLVRARSDGPEKILQYRIKYDSTVRAGHTNINVGRHNPYLIWSEWMDVQEVNDAD